MRWKHINIIARLSSLKSSLLVYNLDYLDVFSALYNPDFYYMSFDSDFKLVLKITNR